MLTNGIILPETVITWEFLTDFNGSMCKTHSTLILHCCYHNPLLIHNRRLMALSRVVTIDKEESPEKRTKRICYRDKVQYIINNNTQIHHTFIMTSYYGVC